jgi:Tfp pilus assembly protein PilO
MAQDRKQLLSALNQFYYKPVARVSMELLLSLGTVVFFAMFAIRPTLITMSDLIKEIEDKRKLDQQLGQKVAALSTAQTEYLSLESDLPFLEEALPTTPRFIESVKIIEKAASDNNLVILGLNVPEIPVETTTDKPATQLTRVDVPISVIVTGEYLNIRQFVETLKNNRRTFALETVVFSTSDDKGKRSLRASLTFSVPYLGAKAVPPAGGGTAPKKDTIEGLE